jgi:hypothetical protein
MRGLQHMGNGEHTVWMTYAQDKFQLTHIN